MSCSFFLFTFFWVSKPSTFVFVFVLLLPALFIPFIYPALLLHYPHPAWQPITCCKWTELADFWKVGSTVHMKCNYGPSWIQARWIFLLSFCTYGWLAMPRLCYDCRTFGLACSWASLLEACGALIHTYIHSFSGCMKRARRRGERERHHAFTVIALNSLFITFLFEMDWGQLYSSFVVIEFFLFQQVLLLRRT